METVGEGLEAASSEYTSTFLEVDKDVEMVQDAAPGAEGFDGLSHEELHDDDHGHNHSSHAERAPLGRNHGLRLGGLSLWAMLAVVCLALTSRS